MKQKILIGRPKNLYIYIYIFFFIIIIFYYLGIIAMLVTTFFTIIDVVYCD